MSFSIASNKRKKPPNLFDLITYIKETHHIFARSQLYRIATFLAEIEKDGTAAILEIKHCYHKLQADLLPLLYSRIGCIRSIMLKDSTVGVVVDTSLIALHLNN